MRPDRSTVRDVRGNLEGQRIRMSVDLESLPHLMNVLTDLYADPELAALRETVTNALDSHVAAGQSRPVEVTLPSPLSPVLTVRDFGLGLSLADVENIYVKYGASTKRDTNAQSGMLGLGCKAPLTYADQFTITATKDGVRVQVSVSRDADGAGTFTVVDTRATDEGDGVEVSIPAKRDNRFAELAAELFSYWPAGSVIVNGEAPERVTGRRVTDSLLVADALEERGPNRHRVVQGGVPYPAHFSDLSLPGDLRLVAHVPIGSVNFPPNRESLMDDPRTRRTLEGIVSEYAAKLPVAAEAAVQNAPDPAAALSAALEWRGLGVQFESLTWQGRPMPLTLKAADLPSASTPKGGPAEPIRSLPLRRRYYSDRGIGKFYPESAVSAGEWARSVIVLGFNLGDTNASHRHKLDAHAEATGVAPESGWLLVAADALPADVRPWIDPARVTTWEAVKESHKAAVKRERAANAPAGVAPAPVSNGPRTYPAHADNGTRLGQWDDFPAAALAAARAAGVPVFYLPLVSEADPSRWASRTEHMRQERNRAEARYLRDRYPGAIVVRLAENRRERFERDHPTAENGADVIAAEARHWWRTLPLPDRRALRVRWDAREWRDVLAALDPDAIPDPALAIVARACQDAAGRGPLERYAAYEAAMVPDLPPPRGNGWGEFVVRRYPLLGAVADLENGAEWHREQYGNRRRYQSETVDLRPSLMLYLEAAYAARKDG